VKTRGNANDPKLSDRGVRRGTRMVRGKVVVRKSTERLEALQRTDGMKDCG